MSGEPDSRNGSVRIAKFSELPHFRHGPIGHSNWTKTAEGMLTIQSIKSLLSAKHAGKINRSKYNSEISLLGYSSSIPRGYFIILTQCCEAIFDGLIRDKGQLSQLRRSK